jgi:hypothetical protein
VTRRHDELETAVKASETALFAGIELTDLTLDDLVTYLLHPTDTTPADDTDTTARAGWKHVLNELRHHPDYPACARVLAVGLAFGLGYGLVVALVKGLVLGLGGGLAAGFMVGLGVGTLTAWGRWVVLVRIWLPLTGRLPWAVNAFLDDAYERGVLRQAGAVYQFRHARFRDRLAKVYEQHEEPTAGRGSGRPQAHGPEQHPAV